jgi:hypothetical protein
MAEWFSIHSLVPTCCGAGMMVPQFRVEVEGASSTFTQDISTMVRLQCVDKTGTTVLRQYKVPTENVKYQNIRKLKNLSRKRSWYALYIDSQQNACYRTSCWTAEVVSDFALRRTQGASGIDARFSKLDFSSEKWVRVMKFDLLILWSILYTGDVKNLL